MAGIAKDGYFSKAQALTAGTTVSAYVIDLSAYGIDGPQPAPELYLDIETVVADSGGTGDTYTVNLVLDDTEACTSVVYTVLSIPMTNPDPRIATIGRKIYSGKLPNQVRELARDGYRYLALQYVLANVGGTAGVTVNAAINIGEPQTQHGVQVLRSNVGVPS